MIERTLDSPYNCIESSFEEKYCLCEQCMNSVKLKNAVCVDVYNDQFTFFCSEECYKQYIILENEIGNTSYSDEDLEWILEDVMNRNS